MFIFKKEEKTEKDVILADNIQTLQELQRQFKKLRELYGSVQSYAIGKSLRQICLINDEIFKEISLNQNKVSEVATFINYYIPTLIKIVTHYKKTKESKVTNSLNEGTMANIETVLGELEVAFNKIHHDLYRENQTDIYAEVKVLLQKLEESKGRL